MKNSLAVAIEALSWMAYEGVGERTALFRASKQLGCNPDELRQAHRLVMESTRLRNRVEHIGANLMHGADLERAPHGVRSFITILIYLKEAGGTARELKRTVSLGRQILGWKELHPYEIVIGNILTERSCIKTRDEYEKVALETCHPSWYVKRVMLIFGRDFGLKILSRNLTSVPTYFRRNTLRGAATFELDEQTFRNGGEVAGMRGVWRLDNPRALGQLRKTVASGDIIIQDLSGVVTGLVCGPEAGDTVLDVCSAPGNKTSHFAGLMANKGHIFSIDISPERMAHWKLEMARTNCLIAEPIITDARNLELNIEADVVIVDPPCSSSGVFAKNPSMKWRISPSRLDVLRGREFAILQSSSRHVRCGGCLVYCTCSILPEENEDVVADFLCRNPDFHVERQVPFLGSPGLKGFDRFQRFYTHLHDCNGYFIAKLRKG